MCRAFVRDPLPFLMRLLGRLLIFSTTRCIANFTASRSTLVQPALATLGGRLAALLITLDFAALGAQRHVSRHVLGYLTTPRRTFGQTAFLAFWLVGFAADNRALDLPALGAKGNGSCAIFRATGIAPHGGHGYREQGCDRNEFQQTHVSSPFVALFVTC